MTSRLALAMALVAPGAIAMANNTSLMQEEAPGRPPSEAMRAAPTVPHLIWSDCGNGFQCANASVPLDYDKPHADKITVALVRKPALDQAHRIGSLFLNPGGPGDSGIDFVRTAPPPAFQLFAQFDVVGFDPRGLGASRPAVADCGTNPSYVEPLPRPTTVDEHAFLADTFDYVRKCRKVNREILPHVSTANVARDLDLIRAAVGDSHLNYIGLSYGSVIGATYATMFPGRARAMVLDSPIDVQGYYDDPVQQWREHAGGHEHVLGRFLAACAASPATCGFGGNDPAAALERLLARLDREPVPSSDPTDPRTLSGDDVRIVFETILRRRSLWPFVAAGLSDAEAGDGSTLLSFFTGGGDGSGDDFQTAVLGADQRYRRGPIYSYFDLADRSYIEFPHFWYLSGYWDLVRAEWAVEDRDAFRGRIRNPASAAPILVIGITHDPATPYVQAQRVTKDLGNARLLTFDADGHGAATTFDPCVLQAVAGYIIAGVLPAEGAICVQAGDPFPAFDGLKQMQAPEWNFGSARQRAVR